MTRIQTVSIALRVGVYQVLRGLLICAGGLLLPAIAVVSDPLDTDRIMNWIDTL